MEHQILKSLSEIYKLLEHYRIEKAKTELYDANRFNPFQFIETDENGLSRILAFFLDPKEKHGQQDLFLNTFLKYLKLYDFLAYDQISVTCEKATSKNRRHDIFIEGWLNGNRRWIISIENKLKGACDQVAQLTDYYSDLESYRVPFFLIYLPKFKTTPSEGSVGKDKWLEWEGKNQAKALRAKDIVKWLEQTPVLAPPITNFCKDFICFLKENIMNKVNNDNNLLDQVINNKNWLGTAISLIESSESLYEKLDNMIIEQLQKLLENAYPKFISYNWYFNSFGHSTGFYLDKGDVDKQPWGIGIEFDSSNCKDAYYGVWARKADLSPSKYEQLSSVFECSGFKNSKNWLYWKWCDENLKNWNAETWQKVTTGELAKQIFELLRPFIEDTNKHLDELEALPCK